MTRTVHLTVRQALLEQRSFWRSAEYALFTFAFPLMILLLIGAANAGSHLPGTDIKNTTVFVPGILAFGVIVAAYVNLGSKVAVLRHDGVLKRIRTTPLPSGAYIGGLLVSTVATVGFITAATGMIGWLAFGAVPRPHAGLRQADARRGNDGPRRFPGESAAAGPAGGPFDRDAGAGKEGAMSPTLDAFLCSWPFDPWLLAALALSAAVYFRGWLCLHRRDARRA